MKTKSKRTVRRVGSGRLVRRIDYLKYRLAHERAKQRAIKKERNETVNDLVTRLTKARKAIARLREYVHNFPSCF